jgi:ABC-type tungstate transport system substrate-binding protein
MTQMQSGSPVVEVRPQANIYTVLLVVAILVLAVTVGVVLYNLLSAVGPDGGYGLEIGDLFKPLDDLPG